jgi:hypothetical protein
MARRTAMTPEWSRYAAKLKNTEVIAGAIARDASMLGRVTHSLMICESVREVSDAEVRALLMLAEKEVH